MTINSFWKNVIYDNKKIPKCGYHDRLFVLDANSQPFFEKHLTDDSVVEVSKDGFTTKTEEISVDSEHTSFTISLEATSEENGGETTCDEPTGETTEESFPSFRKVYKYRGGFDKWVYDQLKGASENTEEDTGGE